MNLLQQWFMASPARERARRWTLRVLVGFVMQAILGALLGRMGVVSQILSPTPGAKQILFGFLAVMLMLLRLIVIVFGPSVLLAVWLLAIWPAPAKNKRADETIVRN